MDQPPSPACVLAAGIALLAFSSDLVFDGEGEAPYTESSAPAPLGIYGQSKVAAEQSVADLCPWGLIVRTSACFGPWDTRNFVTCALRALAFGSPWRAAGDVTVSPTYIPDLAHACLDLLIDGAHGIWHLANEGAMTWADLARAVAIRVGLDTTLVRSCSFADLGLAARRPRYSVLSSERAAMMPSLDDALDRYLTACAEHGAPIVPGSPSAHDPAPTRSIS
jgi:dTDP-4-dehydrorhamnose reductase